MNHQKNEAVGVCFHHFQKKNWIKVIWFWIFFRLKKNYIVYVWDASKLMCTFLHHAKVGRTRAYDSSLLTAHMSILLYKNSSSK